MSKMQPFKLNWLPNGLNEKKTLVISWMVLNEHDKESRWPMDDKLVQYVCIKMDGKAMVNEALIDLIGALTQNLVE